MAAYKGTVELIAGITPKNGGKFPLVGAHDVQIDDHDNRLDDRLDGLMTGAKKLNEYFDMMLPDSSLIYEHGSINSSGQNNDYRNGSRARSIEITEALFDFTITPQNGYQLYIYYYDAEGAYVSSRGWVANTTITINKGEYFRFLLMDPVAEADTQTVSVDSIVENFTMLYDKYSTRVESEVKAITNEVEEKVESFTGEIEDYLGLSNFYEASRFEHGSINSSGQNNNYRNGSRARTIKVTKAPFNFTITPQNGYQLYIYYYDAEGAYVSSRGWVANTTITINKGEYFRFLLMDPVAEADTQTVSVDSILDNFVVSYDDLRTEIKKETDRLSNVAEEFHTYISTDTRLDVSLYEHGNIGSAGGNSDYKPGARARTIEVTKAAFDFTITPKNGYQVYIHYYNADGTHAGSKGWIKTKVTINEGEYYRLLLMEPIADSESQTIDLDVIIDNFIISSEVATTIKKLNENTVISRNKEVQNLLPSLKRYLEDTRGGSPFSGLSHNECFAIAHLSDIHLDAVRYQNFIDFFEYYSDYISDVICTGDFVQSPTEVATEIPFMRDIESIHKVLFCMGNHDRIGMTRANAFTNWNLAKWYSDTSVQYEGSNLYYYKDYVKSGSAGYKVRLIVLNCVDYSNESSTSTKVPRYSTAQLAWFVATLKDAAQNGYSVLVGTHFHESQIADNEHGFYTRDTKDYEELDGLVPVTENIIDAFTKGASYVATNIKMMPSDTDAGLISVDADFTGYKGKFLAWMTGHTHQDRIGYSINHPDQLILNVVNGGCHRTDGATYRDVSYMSDLPRVEGLKSEDAFNIYSFDTINEYCKVLRVGADMNDLMVPRKYTSFSIGDRRRAELS